MKIGKRIKNINRFILLPSTGKELLELLEWHKHKMETDTKFRKAIEYSLSKAWK